MLALSACLFAGLNKVLHYLRIESNFKEMHGLQEIIVRIGAVRFYSLVLPFLLLEHSRAFQVFRALLFCHGANVASEVDCI